MTDIADRNGIYYWKCDHASAFKEKAGNAFNEFPEKDFFKSLRKNFPGMELDLCPAHGQGNHRTFKLLLRQKAFVRIKNGPEHDGYFDVEALVLKKLWEHGIPVPHVLAHDSSRSEVPFAWQVLEYLPASDLNQVVKEGKIDPEFVAFDIGAAVARWQAIRFEDFGPFSAREACCHRRLKGLFDVYEDYYRCNLDRHLEFLIQHSFLAPDQSAEIIQLVNEYRDLLALSEGCLVHKDLALWNILGTEEGITGFIDWDDVISGDPMDDLSLLGCFYDGKVLSGALRGYISVRALPSDYRRRFWLHLLRNMIVKAVIRTGGGYFNLDDGFFLIGAGASGSDLKAFTLKRLNDAIQGLRNNAEIESL